MLTNSDRVKWIKLLWLEHISEQRSTDSVLLFFVKLQKCNADLLAFRRYKGDSYQRVSAIVQSF